MKPGFLIDLKLFVQDFRRFLIVELQGIAWDLFLDDEGNDILLLIRNLMDETESSQFPKQGQTKQ